VPAQALDIVVLLEGTLESCQATPSQDLLASTMDGAVIGAAPTAVDEEPNGTGLISVEADVAAQDGAQITLTCQDVYGQLGSAVFEVAAP
jgi:hypothetical protein